MSHDDLRGSACVFDHHFAMAACTTTRMKSSTLIRVNPKSLEAISSQEARYATSFPWCEDLRGSGSDISLDTDGLQVSRLAR